MSCQACDASQEVRGFALPEVLLGVCSEGPKAADNTGHTGSWGSVKTDEGESEDSAGSTMSEEPEDSTRFLGDL